MLPLRPLSPWILEGLELDVAGSDRAAVLRRAGLEQEAQALRARENAPVSGTLFTPSAELAETLRDLGYAGDH